MVSALSDPIFKWKVLKFTKSRNPSFQLATQGKVSKIHLNKSFAFQEDHIKISVIGNDIQHDSYYYPVSTGLGKYKRNTNIIIWMLRYWLLA